MKKPNPAELKAVFRHVVYAPDGEIEGLLVEADGAPQQIVFERHDDEAPQPFATLRGGEALTLRVAPLPASPKGPGEHPVHAFETLLSVDGQKPRPGAAGALHRGRVVRLNYARHGAVNGVVLDSGDFVHLKPDGFDQLQLAVGDTVEAHGDARRLADGAGWAVEAASVNGRAVRGH